MASKKQENGEELAKRRAPCIIAYLHPFRLITAELLEPWAASIDQINKHSWDYSALHELIGGIEVGLPNPYHLVVARDGALALPPIERLMPDQAAVEFYNHCLAGLLLGGIYCEAITPDALDIGSIINWKYVRSTGRGTAGPNLFHQAIRHTDANPREAIALLNPRTVSFEEVKDSMSAGLEMLSAIPSVRGEYLLKGTTGLARREWGAALSNLWIVIEQLISELWNREIVKPTLKKSHSKSRRDQLTDYRTWTTAARIELLYQTNVIQDELRQTLSKVRGARNDLSHKGNHPSHSDAENAFESVRGLLVLALEGNRPPLLDLKLSDHAKSDPFAFPAAIEGEPSYWMAIPKLPGEEELEKAEAKLQLEKNLYRAHAAKSEPKK